MSRTTESPVFSDTRVNTTRNLLAPIPELLQARFNLGSLGRADLPGGLVSTEFANEARVVLLPAVEDGHVVVSAVGVKLHIKLPESQDNHLGQGRSEGSSSRSSSALGMGMEGWQFSARSKGEGLTWSCGAMMCQEQLMPGG